jgi:NAD(P)-dependent dehydrogenase (short-subunit alcohol dehydrogenase family)
VDRFTGKTVLVTGGGSGIGRAAAQAFAAEGASVVVAGRNAERLDHSVKLIEADGGKASSIEADVTKEDQVRQLVEAIVARHGGLDVACNNAGLFGGGSIAEIDHDTWAQVIDVNLTGVWLSMKHEIPAMRERGGAIVNVGSNIGAHFTKPGAGPYAAAKAGVSALTRVAAREAIGDGVRINAVSPGAVDAPMSLGVGETSRDRHERLKDFIPLGRVAALDEVTSAILWLASDESGSMVGHDLVIDGGVAA